MVQTVLVNLVKDQSVLTPGPTYWNNALDTKKSFFKISSYYYKIIFWYTIMVISSDLNFAPAFDLIMQLFNARWQGDKTRLFRLIYEF